ncbi:2228_t:CDS:2 [Entrophospora sp. SA101]|nr:12861_t:CDS:2 [Entrophospora sp. SA101]CAJ0911755.1 2228_t:CDS:2 [Entrophospora sp. SA101]
MTSTIVSTPGKVLVAGGYLILDRNYDGLVVAVDSRFYTVIKKIEAENTFCNSNNDNSWKINVISPQFNNTKWEYKVIINDYNNKEDIRQCELMTLNSNESGNNTFIDVTLKFALSIIIQRIDYSSFSKILEKGLNIFIVGSNDFYSQREQVGNFLSLIINDINDYELIVDPLFMDTYVYKLKNQGLEISLASLRSLKPFCKLNKTLKNVHKTGLGSSAALITSFVTALFVHFNLINNKEDVDDNYSRTLIHNVAQFCHCFAQGKIGSGFDVSAGVWGSHTYKRFSTMSESVSPFSLPPGFNLILADIDTGSNTPSMVSKVLQWRKNDPEQANKLWEELNKYNKFLADNLTKLTKEYDNDQKLYCNTIEICSNSKASEWLSISEKNPNESYIIRLLSLIYTTFQNIRKLLREMSKLSKVPIEPPEQTKLLDLCNEIPGVVLSGVPGAGGYDAIFCIYITPISSSTTTAFHSIKGDGCLNKLEQLFYNYKGLDVLPLLSKESSKGFLIHKNIDDVYV